MTFIGQSKVQFQPSERLGEGFVQFDDCVIGGQVVDGKQGDGHAPLSVDGGGSCADSSMRLARSTHGVAYLKTSRLLNPPIPLFSIGAWGFVV